jgi:hypothetical protein
LLLENNRLEGMLKDQEKAWVRINELEEEREEMRTELGVCLSLKRRLDEAQGLEKALVLRAEELEQSEFLLRERLAEKERAERKALETSLELRHELTSLSNKCCQLEEEVEQRVGREQKYRAEIQALSLKVKGSEEALEERERLEESRVSSLQAQVYFPSPILFVRAESISKSNLLLSLKRRNGKSVRFKLPLSGIETL